MLCSFGNIFGGLFFFLHEFCVCLSSCTFNFYALLRCPILNLFSWVTGEKRTRLHKRLCSSELLVVHCYCFPVDPGVSEVCLADEYSFLDTILHCIELKMPSVNIDQSFETVRMLLLLHSIPIVNPIQCVYLQIA